MAFDYGIYWCEFGGAKNGFFKRNIMFNVGNENYEKLVSQFLKEYKNTDVYQCIYSYEDNNIAEAKLYAPMYFDLDGDISSKEGFDQLKLDVIGVIDYFKTKGLKDNEFEIYFSGSKGFHIIIPAEVLGIVPSKKLNEFYKAWAEYIHKMIGVKSIDLKIYDRRRLFRIPGSINSKTGLYKILVEYEILKSIPSFKELETMAKNYCNGIVIQKEYSLNEEIALNFNKTFDEMEGRKVKKATISLPEEKQDLLPCVQEVLKSGVGEGGRNNTLAYISSAILQSGYSLEETVELLTDWNQLNNPPLEDKEVTMTIESTYKMLLDGKRYGCNSFKENGYCVDRNCRLGEVNK
jgi:hypothetical protein